MRRVAVRERANWRGRADELGFVFHGEEGEKYWDESAYFAFTLRQIEDDLEAPTGEIEEMCLAFVARAVRDEAVLRRLAIPPEFWDFIAASWARQEKNLYGRLDFAYDGRSPAKLLEYNADTPTSLFEASVFQWTWLEDAMAAGLIPGSADQFNSIHERLIAAWPHVAAGARKLHLVAVPDSAEDRGTIAYLADCAQQAGLPTELLAMEDIGRTDAGRFVDLDNQGIALLFKLYPWEWLFREPFGRSMPQSGTRFVEPPWKALVSNKGLLAYLWQMAPGHPNLLPAYFEGDPAASALAGDVVRKPIYSREGANIEVRRAGRIVARGEDQSYGAEGHVLQQATTIPHFEGGYVVLGSWLVASQPCGLGVRESDTPVTGNTARFLPHAIID
jgi:glutathionylspermidine synthase